MTALEQQIAGRGYAKAKIEVAAAITRALRLCRHLGRREAWRAVTFDSMLQIDPAKIGMAKRL